MLFRYKNKKILIIGINHLSLFFAKTLSKNKDVILLDKNYKENFNEMDLLIERIDEDLLTSYQKLAFSNLSHIIAMTDNDEYNLFACSLAKEYSTIKTMAMNKSMAYNNLLYADLIFNPYQIVMDQIDGLINETRFKYIKNFIPGKINIGELIIKNGDSFLKKKIKDIKLKEGLIIAINRNNKTIIAEAELEVLTGDKLYIIYKKGKIGKVLKGIWPRTKIKNKIFIIGGNDLAFIQAKRLQEIYDTVTIIEPDLEICNKLAEKADDLLILHGEGIELKMFLDEGLEKSSIILSLDNNDFHNILSSYLLKEKGYKNIITLLNNDRYKNLSKSLELEQTLLLPDLISKHLNFYINSAHNFDKLFLGKNIVISKIEVKKRSSVINKKIGYLHKKKGFLISVIIRDNQIVLPYDSLSLQEEDQLLVLSYKEMDYKIYNIFK